MKNTKDIINMINDYCFSVCRLYYRETPCCCLLTNIAYNMILRGEY